MKGEDSDSGSWVVWSNDDARRHIATRVLPILADDRKKRYCTIVLASPKLQLAVEIRVCGSSLFTNGTCSTQAVNKSW